MSQVSTLELHVTANDRADALLTDRPATVSVDVYLRGHGEKHLGSLTCTPAEFDQLRLTLLFGDKGAARGGAPAIFTVSDLAQQLLDAEAARRDRDIFQDGAGHVLAGMPPELAALVPLGLPPDAVFQAALSGTPEEAAR